MTRIDAHIHLFEHGYSGNRPSGEEVSQYQLLRTQYQVHKALVVGFEGEPRFGGNNRYVLRLAQEHDWVVPLSYLHPARATAADVDAAVAQGAAGFTLYLGRDPLLVSQVDQSVWDAMEHHCVLLSINAAPPALEGLGEVLSRLPSVPVLISHLGLPGPAAPTTAADEPSSSAPARTAALAKLARYAQVIVKLSGLYAIDPRYPHVQAQEDVSEVLEAYGPNRLVWGSDYSPGLDTVSPEELFAIPDWVTERLSTDELADLTGQTLHHLLRN